MSALATGLTAAMAAGLNGIIAYSNGTQNFSTTFGQMFQPLLLFGQLFSSVQPLFQIFTEVMNRLQPVLEVFNPVTLISGLGSVFGFGGSNSLVSSTMNWLTGAAGQLLGWVYKGMSTVLDALGIASSLIGTPAGYGLPTTAQMQTEVTGWHTSTGDTLLPNLVNPILLDPTTVDSGKQMFQVGMDVLLKTLAGLALVPATVANELLAVGGGFAGPEGLVAVMENVPMADFLFCLAGIVLDIAGALYAPSNFVKFEY